NTAFHLDRIVEVIRASLYEEFGARSFDRGAAQGAYGGLLEALRIGPTDRWVYATTNYDPIGETAIADCGRLPDYGVAPFDLTREAPIVAHNLLDGMPRYVPVLHLHGRVGWYRRPSGDPYCSTVQQH